MSNSIKVLAKMDSFEHEQVVFCQDKETGLKAIIAIHDTTLGPALGGTRMWNYDNEEDALEDVLRLSRGMSFLLTTSKHPPMLPLHFHNPTFLFPQEQDLKLCHVLQL